MAHPPKGKGFKRPIKPIPEAVSEPGSPWTIEEARASHVVISERRIAVPFGHDALSKQARTHELAHVRFSPEKVQPPEGVSQDILLACEDGRLNTLMRMVDIDNDATHFTSEESKRHLQERVATSPRVGASMLIASIDTGDEQVVREILEDCSPTLTRLVDKIYTRYFMTPGTSYRYGDPEDHVPYENTELAAKALTKILEPVEKRKSDGDGDEGEPDWDEDLMEGLEAMMNASGDMLSEDASDNRWGTMTIVRPDMPLTLPPRLKHTRQRSVEEGMIMTRPHRWAIDKAIFGRKTRRPSGGSVLIDASGSMSFSAEDLFDLLKLLPAATVAMYSANDSRGQLTYLALNGRRVANPYDHMYGGANVIDGPALDWLMEHPHPRIWVSDGYVTGIGDRMAPNLMSDAVDKVRRGKIRRLDDMDEVVEYVQAKGYATKR